MYPGCGNIYEAQQKNERGILKMKHEIPKKMFIYAILLLMSLLIVFPLIYCLSASLKTNMEIMAMPEKVFPKELTFDNYRKIMNSDSFNIGHMLFNSVWYTVLSVCITVFLSMVCGYVFARGEFPGKKLIFLVFSALMFISLGSITIYPVFDVLSILHLNDSLMGLVVMQCFGIPVVNMYLVRGFINGLPREIDEAASIDGCSFIDTLFKIIAPMLKPILITIGMLAFNSSWNSYLMPALFTMTRPEQQTLIVGIMEFKNTGEAAAAWNLILAATTVTIIPVVAIYIVGNKYITEGFIAGAVKG